METNEHVTHGTNNEYCSYSSNIDYCRHVTFSAYSFAAQNCHYCESVFFCKNLKLTRNNIFCSAECLGDPIGSISNPPYRVFNRLCSYETYRDLLEKITDILRDFTDWDNVTDEQWLKLAAVDGFDLKIVEFISGKSSIDVLRQKPVSLTGRKVKVTIDGTIYTATID